MVKKLALGLIVFITISTQAQVVPNIDWVKYYSENNTMDNIPSTLDAVNNVYVTGYTHNGTNRDISVLKYDSLGTLLWTQFYGSISGDDEGTSIKVDPAGNVYVAGYTYVSGQLDLFTAKYSSTGTQLWANTYDVTGADDKGVDIEFDASGKVYVLATTNNGSDKDITVIRYTSGGSVDYIYDYNPYTLDDNAVGMVLMSTGEVMVTGNSNNGSFNEIHVFQLDGSGNLINSNKFNGTGSGDNKVTDIVAAANNIVICGSFNNSGTNDDYVTLKIDNTITAIWQADYDVANGYEYATSLVKDSIGNIAVTGYVSNGGIYEYHTLLYDSTGTQLWTNIENTGIAGLYIEPRIARDTIAHHFYVSGAKANTTNDIAVYQITPTGNTTWKEEFDGPANGHDAGTGLVVNGLGVVYLSALCTNTTSGFDITTVKISQTPVYFPLDLGAQELNDKQFVFQENRGQLLSPTGSAISNTSVAFYNTSRSPAMYFNKSRISSILINRDTITNLPDSLVRVDMNFSYANQATQIYNYNRVDDKKHYFTVSNVNGITDVESYERLFIPNLYSNIDVHHYSNTAGLKTYFVCKTAEIFSKPIINISGALTTTINGSGELIATTDLGTINYGKLTAYQATVNPTTLAYTLVPVTSAAWNSLGSNNYGFNVTGYNTGLPLVIYFSKQGATSSSAVANINNLYWCTSIGNVGYDETYNSEVDSKDNYYRVGRTTAINFPATPGAFQSGPSSNPLGVLYGILNKFKNDGSVLYGTYYGGNGTNGCGNAAITQISDIAIDSLFNTYIVGYTTSNNMTVKSNTISGSLNYTATAANSSTAGICINAFIAKLNPQGNALHFASYYGGNNNEKFECVKYMNGQIYLGGLSVSATIPLVSPQPNTYQISSGGGLYMHLDTTGLIKHNTKLQNPIVDGDADKNGNYYMVSSLTTTFVPTQQPAPSFYVAGSSGGWEWGIQRFSLADSLTWSTHYGGLGNDFVAGICIKDSVMAICGKSDYNFPIVKTSTDSGHIVHSNDFDISLVKFNIKTGQRLWSAMHATGNTEYPYGVAIDKDYNLFVTGNMKCGPTNTAYPTCPPNSFKNFSLSGYYLDSTKIGGQAFVLGFNNKNQRKWTTQFGSKTGSSFNDDYGYAISVNNSNKLFIAGDLTPKNNSMPFVKWNSVCYYDSTVADPISSSNPDSYIAMFDISNFIQVGVHEYDKVEITNNVSLYPNPNNGIFTLQFKVKPEHPVNFNVINILGQKVYEMSNYRAETNELNIDLNNLTKGIYFITISENNKTGTIKFIVQ